TASVGAPSPALTRAYEVPRLSEDTSANPAAASRQTAAAGPSRPDGPTAARRSWRIGGIGIRGRFHKCVTDFSCHTLTLGEDGSVRVPRPRAAGERAAAPGGAVPDAAAAAARRPRPAAGPRRRTAPPRGALRLARRRGRRRREAARARVLARGLRPG